MIGSDSIRLVGARRTMFMFLMVLAFLCVYLQPLAWADGVSTDPKDGPGGQPGTNNGQGHGPNKPGNAWPPAGTAPKGPFVDGGFAGTWYAFVDNTAFTLVIEQEGQLLKVAHTAIYDYGRRVDSSVGVVSMAGTVNGSLAYLEWKSGLSAETGRATLEYMPGRPITLHWKIVEAPKKPESDTDSLPTTEVGYFLPASAYLMRK